ncbi:SusC/RagA family TonB-linked outer membrane protein [Parapedobacter lycopersici]|uniref:SusC/RagA family TonB-linked outer membrane protein n=1 Tax=Parapedobacter lycopersici TaxID=1864939 RepID=UPI00214D8BBF|nr:TonB-dependent receptor [Parapedobacter lycopersici]
MNKRLFFFAWALLCTWVYVAEARQMAVTGRVTDAMDGSPLSGVTVVIKGSTVATATGNDGRYRIDIPDGNAVLSFSAVGYAPQEIRVGNNTVVDAQLTVSNRALDEVMVVAYGTATRDTYTGSAAVIRQEDIQDVPTVSFEGALSGRVPGIQVTASSGQAGSAPSIRIRGIGSMNASNEPLYVIDGVPVVSGSGGQFGDYLYTSNNILNSLNPSDIESITVLKDAAASSLYGSRAANGVVVITTKKGQLGKPVINIRSSVGFTPSWATDNYEPAGVQQQVNMLYQVFHDLGTSNGSTEAEASETALDMLNSRFNRHGYYFETAGPGVLENVAIRGLADGLINREGTYFDWEDRLFRTGIYQTNDLSVSGGTESTRYYSSLSYTKDQNRIVINDYDRIAGRVNLSQKIGKHVEFISNISISNNKQQGFNDTRNLGGNYYLQTRNLLWPLYWPTDYKTGEPWVNRYGSYAYNAEYYENEWENSANTLRIAANETLNIQLLPELNVKSVFSYENNAVKEHLYYSANHYDGATSNGEVNEISTAYMKLVSSTTANYNKQFGMHGLDLLAGFEAEKNNTDFQRATGTDLPSSALHSVATAGELDASAYSWGYNMLSVLSRVAYNYGSKYNLSASYRRDGSSRLSPENRWGNFWSVGGAWTISEESFMDRATFFSNLRLRASYGTNGTQPTDNFGWRTLTGYTSRYMGNAGGAINTIGNEALTWETSYSTNVALEIGLFEDRLYGVVEYFNRDSRNLLQDVPISTVTGFGSILRNIGEVNNRGLEIELGYDILREGDWKWSANVNGSFIDSKVTKLYKNEGDLKGQDIIWDDPTGGDDRAEFIYREGESMLSFYGFEWAGVDPENGRNMWYVNHPDGSDVGDFVHNGRGATYNWSDANRVILGSAIPTVYGGLNTNVSYKGFSLGLNFSYKIGGYLYDGAFKDVADDGYYWERIRAQYYDEHRWTVERPGGSLPKLDGNDLTDAMQYSSRQMHNASFLRLKNINLTYTIPTQVVSKIGVSSARVYFNGTNLLTFSRYKIADPEVNQYGTRGWETPYGKTYTFGVEFSF